METMSTAWNFIRDPHNSNAIIAVFTVLIFLTGSIYTVFAALQWSVMHDTLRLERPWLGPVSRTIYPPPENGHMIGIGWHFQNGGRSVATRIRNNLEFRIGPFPTTQDSWPHFEACPKGELPGKVGNISIPGSESVFTLEISSEIAKSMDDVYQRKVGLFLVGCVDYSDSSRKPHYRTEVFELFLPGVAPRFLAHTSGNDAY